MGSRAGIAASPGWESCRLEQQGHGDVAGGDIGLIGTKRTLGALGFPPFPVNLTAQMESTSRTFVSSCNHTACALLSSMSAQCRVQASELLSPSIPIAGISLPSFILHVAPGDWAWLMSVQQEAPGALCSHTALLQARGCAPMQGCTPLWSSSPPVLWDTERAASLASSVL